MAETATITPSGLNPSVKTGLTPQFILTLVLSISGGLVSYTQTSADVRTVTKDMDVAKTELASIRSRISTIDIEMAKTDLNYGYLSQELKNLDKKIDRISDAVGAKKP